MGERRWGRKHEGGSQRGGEEARRPKKGVRSRGKCRVHRKERRRREVKRKAEQKVRNRKFQER